LKHGLPRARFWLGAAVATFVAFNLAWAAWAHWYYGVMWDYCEPDRRFENEPGISCVGGWYVVAIGLAWAGGAALFAPPLLIAASYYRRERRKR
jgi:hypothetical protein